MGSKCSKPGKGINSNSSQKLMYSERPANDEIKEKEDELKNLENPKFTFENQKNPENASEKNNEHKNNEGQPPLANEKNIQVPILKSQSLAQGN
jgi:hypothetical protein